MGLNGSKSIVTFFSLPSSVTIVPVYSTSPFGGTCQRHKKSSEAGRLATLHPWPYSMDPKHSSTVLYCLPLPCRAAVVRPYYEASGCEEGKALPRIIPALDSTVLYCTVRKDSTVSWLQTLMQKAAYTVAIRVVKACCDIRASCLPYCRASGAAAPM